jgi:L-alanine-DL-glutamate epimerase-like enolase superfamily enzyme
MSTYDLIKDLPLELGSYSLEGLQRDVSTGFTRFTTVVKLEGAGEVGIGEDVTYDGVDHVVQQEAGPILPLAGTWTFDSFSGHLDTVDLFPTEPQRPVSRNYRRWAFESAALDLALRQAGRSLADLLGREPAPVSFVCSMRLPEPASADPLLRRLERYPTLRFKLDPTPSWTDEVVAELVRTGAVDSVDLKGQYKGTVVDVPTDPELYRRVAEAFPEAWLEDPDLTPEADEVLRPYRDRITWDAIIHSVEDVEALPFPPKALNIKPSRFGPIRALFEAYDYCAERGIRMYGGGQFELGPGRGQIQALASLFHPDTPNDIAPGGYNDEEPPSGLPVSPLDPRLAPVGFRWDGR